MIPPLYTPLVSKLIAKCLHKFTKLAQDSKPFPVHIDQCLGKEVIPMQAPETMTRADAAVTDEREGDVNLWLDSVGAAAQQLGIVLTLAIAAHFAGSLLFGR